ncbi:MAG: hypothetical protein SFV52_01655 [Saprospiraceae bacterium]|nr:hypothetical protein [Saprospiraceae bacterium]
MKTYRLFYLILWLAAPGWSYSQQVPDTGDSDLFEFHNITKGTAFTGFTGSASTRLSENEDVLLFKIVDQEKRAFNILLSGGYMIKKRLGVGMALQYDYLRNNQTNEDSDGILSVVRQAGSGFSGRGFIKSFIPVTPSGRINLYYDIGITIGRDRLLSESLTENVLTRTYTTTNSFSLGMNPGINVLVVKGFAVELGVFAAGLSNSTKTIYVNDVKSSEVKRSDLDLKLNILALTIGFFYYFKT